MWKEIGYLLGLDRGKLHTISNESTSDCDSLIQVIDTWKKSASSTYPYKWITIIEVLEHPTVNCIELARKVKHYVISQP